MWSLRLVSGVHRNMGKVFRLSGRKWVILPLLPPNNDPSVLSKGSFTAWYFFPMMQWCSTDSLWHLCWESNFRESPFPIAKIHISSCLCRSWPGCPWITCWDWLCDRGQIKWVLWLACRTTPEKNRCRSLAYTNVPITAEPCDWWKEDTTAQRGSRWCQACLWAWGSGGEGREGGWGGKRAPQRTDHLDYRPQRPAWQSQSEQQWTEDSQSADFPSLAFSLAVCQQTHAAQQNFQKRLQLGFFHQLKGLFSPFAHWKAKVNW